MSTNIKVKDNFLKGFIDKTKVEEYTKKAECAYDTLINGTGEGNDFCGWVDLPQNYDKVEYDRIKKAAQKIKSNSEVFIVVGIGGSYLGARAAIEFLRSPLYNNLKKDTPDIYFIGNSLSPDSLNEICELCNGRDFSINVISKSGTTTEPAIAFRVLRKMLEEKYGADGARERVFVTTDINADKSNLKKLAEKNGYETFIVPDDVGGRYSVLTAVGLLPIAVAGVNTDEIMLGAANMRNKCKAKFDANTDAIKYAVLRNVLHDNSNAKSVEILTCYEPSFLMMNEWWKQLFGESEGKDQKGIYPSSTIFSTDLHSLGQFIQDGSRIIFETVVNIIKPNNDIVIPIDSENIDGMDYINNVKLSTVNNKAYLGTVLAHTDGGTPNIIIDIADKTESTFGELVYFFEFACALSGYMLEINPFNQPGVEAYKKNMFALIGKPTDECIARKEEITARLQDLER